MRVLIISFYFPPYNSIGAVRIGKHAKYLVQAGHDVRVLTARQRSADRTLPLEVPEAHVIATNWVNVNRPIELALGGPAAVARAGYVVKGGTGFVGRTAQALGSLYKSVVNFPDGQVGWYYFAVHEARRLLDMWSPDVVYSSSSPATSHLVASRIARTTGVPWIAELRDLWLDNANRQFGHLRNLLEAPVERSVLSSADGLVTVSAPLAARLRRRFDLPVRVVLNGFDPAGPDPDAIEPPSESTILRIVYTGRVYEGKQDPSPLFQALRLLGEEADQIRVTFVGRYLDAVLASARLHRIERCIEVLPQVPYPAALKLQRAADALLLLLWTDPTETGVFTGKLFEYVGAGRPILAVGAHRDVAAALISERKLGTVSSDSELIAAQLRSWLATKRVHRRIPAPTPTGIDDLSREAQTRRLAGFLEEATRGAKHARP